MKSLTLHALALGVLAGVWMLVMGYTGWYKHPTLNGIFFLVVVIQAGVLVSALKGGAKAGKGYLGQIGRGVSVSALGGVIIAAMSLIITTVLFPNFYDEVRAMKLERLRAAGIDGGAMVRDGLEAPIPGALTAYVATLIIGLALSAILAIFIRRKD